MTVSVLKGKHIVTFCKRIEIGVVLQKLHCHVAVYRLSASLVSEEQILRQSVGLIPREGRVFVRSGALFSSRKRLLRQVGDDRTSELLVNRHCLRVICKFLCVNKTARQLVIGVGREPVASEELCLGIKCLGVSFHEAVDLEASWL